MRAGHPTHHVNVITIKWEIIWTGGLPQQSRWLHLPGVPHLHVNMLRSKHVAAHYFSRVRVLISCIPLDDNLIHPHTWGMIVFHSSSPWSSSIVSSPSGHSGSIRSDSVAATIDPGGVLKCSDSSEPWLSISSSTFWYRETEEEKEALKKSFLGNCLPTPSLSQGFALSEN